MSNVNYNGGRGGIKATKATAATEHTFGGSHKDNPGSGSGRVDKLTKGDTYDKPGKSR